MVSSLLDESLASPVQVLTNLYEARKRDGTDSPDFPRAVSEHFSQIFEKPEAFAEIPALNASKPPSSFKPGALVRFRAMVQDTSMAPLLYLSSTPSGGCAGWGIVHSDETNEEDVDYSKLRDCVSVWAVSVPGETAWYQEAVGEDGAVEAKPSRSEQTKGHKFPIPKQAHVGAQIKIYDISSNAQPKVADVVDFVGILDSEPYNTESDDNPNDIVPTLHVLFMRPHNHANPTSTAITLDAAQTRDELISWVADEALGGDREAAEWVLLVAVGRIQSRQRGLLPPSLTLARFPEARDPAAVPALAHVLSCIHPLLNHIPITLDYMNTVPFAPHSEAENLHSGVLQLPAGSAVLVTEGGIREGKLNERGVQNVMTAQEVMNGQNLAYKFPFSDFSFPTDLSFLVVTEGKKSAFWKTDLTVPLKPTNDKADLCKSSITMPPPEKLTAFRELVSRARNSKIELTEAVSQMVADDFVEDRKADPSISPDDLKRSLMLARLEGLLGQEDAISVETWKRTRSLDKARLARLRDL